MADKIISTASTVVSLLSPFLPTIVQLLQGAHPVPPNAPPEIKSDLNILKATGANQVASVLVNQLAAAGGVPANSSDPAVQAMLAGAIEQTYQAMKARGEFIAPPPPQPPPAIPDPVTNTRLWNGYPFNFPYLGKFSLTIERQ